MRKFLDKVTDSDYFLLALLLVLGILNYGWVFFPVLGQVWTAINGIIVLGIVLAAVIYRIGKHLFFKSVILLVFLGCSNPVFADDPILPDPTLTPGAVRSIDIDEICQHGYANPHNLIYLEVGKIDHRDAQYVLRHYGFEIMKIRIESMLSDYFLSPDHCIPYYNKNTVKGWQEWKKTYKMLAFGEWYHNRPWFLMVGFPVLFAYACCLSGKGLYKLRKRGMANDWEIIGVFILITITYIFISQLFLGHDRARYRFMVDPLYFLLLTMLLIDALAAAKKLLPQRACDEKQKDA